MASFLQEFDPQRAVAVRVYGHFSLSLLPSTCPILRELQSFRAVLSQESSWMVGGSQQPCHVGGHSLGK